MSWNSRLAVGISVAIAVIVPGVESAGAGKPGEPTVTELATFAAGECADGICGSGSTVGPDGFLYVPDSTRGQIQRIDPRSGTVTTFADGLPLQLPGVGGGGVADIAFLGRTAYVLVTGTSKFWTDLVGSSNPPAAEGIYRLDRIGAGSTQATLIADLYTWSEQNPPGHSGIFIPGGYTYALEQYKRGFLVTDGHHNRVLRVETNGDISVFHDFAENIVPTGLESKGPGVLVGQAGPVPHTRTRVASLRSGTMAARLRRSPRAPRCWSTWRLAAGTGSTVLRRGSGRTKARKARKASPPRRTPVS